MSILKIQPYIVDETQNFTFANANVTGNIVTGNLLTNNLLYANGSPYQFTTNAAGSNTQIQFNDGNSFAGSANLTFDKTTNTFTTGNISSNNISITGNIIPTANNTFNLGSEDFFFKDVYIGPGSLYINGQKVLEQDANTIVVSADINQSLRITTSGTGTIQLLPSGTGVIAIDGTLQINSSKSITSSDGNSIKFGNPISTPSISSLIANTDLNISSNGTGNVKVDDNLIITGNLTVQGNTANLSVNHLYVQDNIIDINAEVTGTPTSNAGIRVVRGDEPAVLLRWNESSTRWQVTNNGSDYLSLVGNDSSGNIQLGNNVVANTFIGNLTGTVASATTAGTVTTNAQPNITSVGLLTSLSVGPNSSVTLTGTTGFVRANSIQGIDGVNAIFPGYDSISGAVGIQTNLTVGVGGTGNLIANTGNAIFGSNANVKITGGSSGQVLSTDGTGNLTWSTISGGSTITDDTSSNTTYYPVYATATSGTMSVAGITTTKLQFVPSTGQLTVQDLNTLSDMTLKENAEVINDPFAILNQISGMSFNWSDTGKKSYGLLAQLLETVLPELVSTNAQGKKTVNYIPIIAFLIEAVKKQQQDINDLKKDK